MRLGKLCPLSLKQPISPAHVWPLAAPRWRARARPCSILHRPAYDGNVFPTVLTFIDRASLALREERADIPIDVRSLFRSLTHAACTAVLLILSITMWLTMLQAQIQSLVCLVFSIIGVVLVKGSFVNISASETAKYASNTSKLHASK